METVKMDTPLLASVHKENFRLGRGNATVQMKSDMLMPIKTAGKERKALADVKRGNELLVGASKDVDLKQKSAMQQGKGNQLNWIPMTLTKQQKAATELCTAKQTLVTGAPKAVNLNPNSSLQGNLGKESMPLSNILTDEEIKQCYEWAKDGIEEMGGYSWSTKDETSLLMNQNISEIMASAIGVPVADLESPLVSDDDGYETDEPPYQNSSLSFPVYTPEDVACLLKSLKMLLFGKKWLQHVGKLASDKSSVSYVDVKVLSELKRGFDRMVEE
ncbi:hypothetical protein HPP92_024784 [Vanilla planifolia]|uniref:Uncharacterized protein n=1 Tax=Vanilla planifolia TaxID=51239 RepID=A0A835PJC9_VANPL|nr:hypothetical protein HPP92_024784 [Vanilla planifolia]